MCRHARDKPGYSERVPTVKAQQMDAEASTSSGHSKEPSEYKDISRVPTVLGYEDLLRKLIETENKLVEAQRRMVELEETIERLRNDVPQLSVNEKRLQRVEGGAQAEIYEIPMACKRYLGSNILREKQILCRLKHPNIIRLLAESDRGDALIMEYCPTTLHDIIVNSVTAIDYHLFMKWSGELASALRYIHDQDIIHRDVKPQNILLNHIGTIKLCDFGVSHDFHCTHEQTKSKVGTRQWWAPELLNGENYDHKVDVWAFGLVVYEILTRLEPHEIHRYQTHDHGSTRIRYPNNGLRSIIDLFHDCFEENPIDRCSMETVESHLATVRHEILEVLRVSENATTRSQRIWNYHCEIWRNVATSKTNSDGTIKGQSNNYLFRKIHKVIPL